MEPLPRMNQSYDVIILGAGGAGLMCAGLAGQRGKSVLVLDHAKKPAEKVRISGGGRCNFTNLDTSHERFLSQNPQFCRNALAAYGPSDFVALVEAYGIAYHEKTLGQLFCDETSQQIIDMLLAECAKGDVTTKLKTEIRDVTFQDGIYCVETSAAPVTASKLVVATGGKSIPKMGATGFGYQLATQFGLGLIEQRAGLVPFTLSPEMKAQYASLSGVSVDALVTAGGQGFREALLFTHRGLSGPAALQASSYWHEGDTLTIDLAPESDLYEILQAERTAHPKSELTTHLARFLPKRLAVLLSAPHTGKSRLADLSNNSLREISDSVHNWRLMPNGTEGYRTAEVTLGGVDTADLNPKTLEARQMAGLHFIGEVVDVTGWLGGYNFQWAWSSAAAAARSL
jgi:predicted Rossmann fold flavoprotein